MQKFLPSNFCLLTSTFLRKSAFYLRYLRAYSERTTKKKLNLLPSKV
jgi:hypothetical protein